MHDELQGSDAILANEAVNKHPGRSGLSSDDMSCFASRCEE